MKNIRVEVTTGLYGKWVEPWGLNLPVSDEIYEDTPAFVSWLEQRLAKHVVDAYLASQNKVLRDGKFVRAD